MVQLNIIPKGNKFTVSDLKGRLIYNIKPGMGGKIHLLDASGYKLYYITAEKKAKKPVFKIFLHDKELFTAECTSMFLDPGFAMRGETINIDVTSHDRHEFKIMGSGNQMGTVTLLDEEKENKYTLEINEKYFDDYIPLIAVFIEMAFGKINKG